MAELKYKSIIPNNKPNWLLTIQNWINQQYKGLPLRNERSEFDVLQYFIDVAISDLSKTRVISRSVISTEIRTDTGKTVLFIKRNDKVLQTYYIE